MEDKKEELKLAGPMEVRVEWVEGTTEGEMMSAGAFIAEIAKIADEGHEQFPKVIQAITIARA